MSKNFHFHPFFQNADRLELTLRVLRCFVEAFAVDRLTLHPPQVLFRSPSLHRYPQIYHVTAKDCLEVNAEAIARADTRLVSKRGGSLLGHADISPASMCAYVARWKEPFEIDFAISDRTTGTFVSNLSLRLNYKLEIKVEEAVCGPIIMGPSVRAYESDLFRFLDLLACVLSIDGLEFGVVALEVYPRIGDAIVFAASRDRLRSLQIADADVTMLDETRSGSGLKLFLRSGGGPP